MRILFVHHSVQGLFCFLIIIINQLNWRHLRKPLTSINVVSMLIFDAYTKVRVRFAQCWRVGDPSGKSWRVGDPSEKWTYVVLGSVHIHFLCNLSLFQDTFQCTCVISSEWIAYCIEGSASTLIYLSTVFVEKVIAFDTWIKLEFSLALIIELSLSCSQVATWSVGSFEMPVSFSNTLWSELSLVTSSLVRQQQFVS